VATRNGFPRSGANDGGVLLERDRELGLLDRLVQSTLAGEAGLALLEGPAGIGKSSLLAKAREKAASAGFRVVAALGSDLDGNCLMASAAPISREQISPAQMSRASNGR
jgi:AAA ATPase-like protein